MAKRIKYNHKIADANKAQRRVECEDRQTTRNLRSNAEQIAKLDAGGFVAKKERDRLKKQKNK